MNLNERVTKALWDESNSDKTVRQLRKEVLDAEPRKAGFISSFVSDERIRQFYTRLGYEPVKPGTVRITLPNGQRLRDDNEGNLVVCGYVTRVWGEIRYDTGQIWQWIGTATYDYDYKAS